MDTCARCGADLGSGRFCLNCGHPVGTPVDPRDDLLPWADPHDVSHQPAGRPPWLAWVLGATALVLVIALVVWWLAAQMGDSDDEAADEPESSETRGSGSEGDKAEPTPQGPRVGLAGRARVRVPATAPGTNDLDGEFVTYEAVHLVDRDPATAWRMPGDGTGQRIRLRLPRQFSIEAVGMINGYAKQVDGVDWYVHNRRVLSATWAFDDGSQLNQRLTERRSMQRVEVPGVLSRDVTLTLTAVSPPGPGQMGRDFTALSEVVVIGRRVG